MNATMAQPRARRALSGVLNRPGLVYWLAAIVIFGAAALSFMVDRGLQAPNRDLWQHLAALRALIDDPWNPENPFVLTAEPSRHFHPYWLTISLVARSFGWSEWGAIHLGAFVSLTTLAVGIRLFGATYYRSPWGPSALLAAMTFGWLFPFSHTGFHSHATLMEGAAYPAALLIGLTLVLWAVTIRSLERPRLTAALVPLVAFMFATHQLGGAIGLIGAACLAGLWPGTASERRTLLAASMAAGLGLSALWPFFNPFVAVLSPGNSNWIGPPNFYLPIVILACLGAAVVGIIGLINPPDRDSRWPFLAMLAIYVAVYLFGLTGMKIASRFLMPAVLVLHIGLGWLIIRFCRGDLVKSGRGKLAVVAVAWGVFVMQVSMSIDKELRQNRDEVRQGNVFEQAQRLTADISDDTPIAAYDVAVWPVVATGQKAASVPWPEPMISDLAVRQASVERLFDSRTPYNERIAIARRLGVNTLIIDSRNAFRRQPHSVRMITLWVQSRSWRRSGPMWRFDLE